MNYPAIENAISAMLICFRPSHLGWPIVAVFYDKPGVFSFDGRTL